MMTLEEMKLAVCEKLPELIEFDSTIGTYIWKEGVFNASPFGDPINWSTEGLQLCHEAEKLLSLREIQSYRLFINRALESHRERTIFHATYEQRLEALCRVWWPERFS